MKRKNLIGKKLIAAALAAVMVILAAGCGKTDSSATGGSADEAELDVINQAIMTGGFDYYTATIGKWQGIFEKYGIDLQTTEYVYGINTIDAIVNGTASIGMMANYAAVNRLGNTLHDTNLVLISELGGASWDGGLYVAPQYADNLDALDGSEGFITALGTSSDYYVWKFIEYLGLDPDAQNMVNTDSESTALAVVLNGEASAYYTSGAQADKVEEYGWVLAVPISELTDLARGHYFLTTEEYYDENQELLVRWMQAVQESFDYIHDNLDACGDYLETNYNVDKAVFEAEWSSMVSKVGFSQEGAQALIDMEEWCYEHGRFEEDYDITQFIRAEVAAEAVPENTTYVKGE